MATPKQTIDHMVKIERTTNYLRKLLYEGERKGIVEKSVEGVDNGENPFRSFYAFERSVDKFTEKAMLKAARAQVYEKARK